MAYDMYILFCKDTKDERISKKKSFEDGYFVSAKVGGRRMQQ